MLMTCFGRQEDYTSLTTPYSLFLVGFGGRSVAMEPYRKVALFNWGHGLFCNIFEEMLKCTHSLLISAKET